MDDPTILAVNTILMELFTLFSYMTDGFAYATEALTGRFIGAKDLRSLKECVRKCIAWCMVVALLYGGLYIGWWRDLLGLFIEDGATEADLILEYAERYIGWIIMIPLVCSLPFMMDGIMVGATQSRIMRNSMLFASVAYFALFFALQPLLGNNALWLAFTSYMALRGVFQYFMSDRLKAIYRQAE
jgi:MATE family multidrug resistance protein